MLRGPLSAPDARTRFAGHETFPLRRLWLRKAYDAVCEDQHSDEGHTFDKDRGIVRFGVGKNMVSAIKHWSLLCEVISNSDRSGFHQPTELGHFLFDEDVGVDLYLENISTTWLMHWMVSSNHETATTWYYAFNNFNTRLFDRERLSTALMEMCRGLDRTNASAATLKRDVECFVRSYVPRAGAVSVDDQVECLFGELNLLNEVTARTFEFNRGPKPTLADGVFAYALADFWDKRSHQQSTLSIEAIAYEPGSPGRVFKLDEASVVDRLLNIENVTDSAFVWSDSAGVRNIAKREISVDKLSLLRTAYRHSEADLAAA